MKEPKYCGAVGREIRPYLCVRLFATDGIINHVHILDEQIKNLPKIMRQKWISDILAKDGVVRVDVSFNTAGE